MCDTEQPASADNQQNADNESKTDENANEDTNSTNNEQEIAAEKSNDAPSNDSEEAMQEKSQNDQSNEDPKETTDPSKDEIDEEPQNEIEQKQDQPQSSRSEEKVNDNNNEDQPQIDSNQNKTAEESVPKENAEKSDTSKSTEENDKSRSSESSGYEQDNSPKIEDNPQNDENENDDNENEQVEKIPEDQEKSDTSKPKEIEASQADGDVANDEEKPKESEQRTSEVNKENSNENQDIHGYGDASTNDPTTEQKPATEARAAEEEKEDVVAKTAKEKNQEEVEKNTAQQNKNQEENDEKKQKAEQNQNIYAYGDASANNFAYGDDPKQEQEQQSEPKQVQQEKEEIAAEAADENVEENEEKKENKEENQNIYAYGNASANDFAYGDDTKPAQAQKEEQDIVQEEVKEDIVQQNENEEEKKQHVDEEEEARDTVPKLDLDRMKSPESMPMSPESVRVTAMHDRMLAMRRFDGNGLPLVGCLRCNNSFFVEKIDQLFMATARQKNLKYSFTFVPDPIEEDVYNIIHVESGCYLTVKRMGLNYTLFAVNNDDIMGINRDDLCFTIVKISSDKEINLRVTIKWQDRFLTAKEAFAGDPQSPAASIINNKLPQISEDKRMSQLNDEDIEMEEVEEKHGDNVELNDIKPEIVSSMESRQRSKLDGTDVILVFDEAYVENIDSQIFIIERAIEEETDDEMNILFLLDLVDEPREDKIGHFPRNLSKYKHIPYELTELVQQIYVRIDENKTGYANYNDLWSQFVQYSQGLIPRTVIEAFEGGIDSSPIDVSNKLCHIKNFIAAIDTIIEFHENEIKMERLELEKEKMERAQDPIDIKLRRLDTDILIEHPFVEQWQNMSGFRRKLYDWNIWFYNKWTSGGNGNDAGFFLWRKHLVNIQGNYGESIFAFFQFTRWLMMLNCMMALFYGILIFAHVWSFPFSNYAITDYLDMALGNEFERSWWFYGAYQPNYAGSAVTFDVGFMWIVVSVASALISVIAVLQVLLNAGVQDDDEYVFSQNVFSNYDHSFQHKDAVTLQTNSIMIQLHETLLDKIDDEINVLTCKLFLIRCIGVLFCIIVGVLSAAGITALIFYESDVILPYAQDLHPIMESIAPYIVPAGVSVIKAVTPHIVRRIVLFESYSAGILFQQTFFRVFLLRIFAILVTLFQTSRTAEEMENEEGAACAESQIGMVLYKFIMFDMITEIVTCGIVPGLKYCCGRCCGSIKNLSEEEELAELNRKNTEHLSGDNKGRNSVTAAEFEIAGDSWKAQFDIPGALVDVMYRQGIVWSGMYFSPMIPIMAIIASMVTFFIKKRYLFGYCGRPKKALGVTKQLKFFYGMMLLAIITSFIPLNYLLGRTPSCGPHQEENVLNETETTLDEDMPIWLKTIFGYVFNGLLLLPILILTLVYLGYVRGTRKTHEINAQQLKERLLKEKAEKKQILKDYNIKL